MQSDLTGASIGRRYRVQGGVKRWQRKYIGQIGTVEAEYTDQGAGNRRSNRWIVRVNLRMADGEVIQVALYRLSEVVS